TASTPAKQVSDIEDTSADQPAKAADTILTSDWESLRWRLQALEKESEHFKYLVKQCYGVQGGRELVHSIHAARILAAFVNESLARLKACKEYSGLIECLEKLQGDAEKVNTSLRYCI